MQKLEAESRNGNAESRMQKAEGRKRNSGDTVPPVRKLRQWGGTPPIRCMNVKRKGLRKGQFVSA